MTAERKRIDMDTSFERQSELYRTAVEGYLAAQFTEEKPWKTLYDSMRYSLLAGGKRIRPMLTLEFCRLNGGDWKKALPFGCAVEMVHTYSLIHDDLPCMDDDALRRGKATNHIVYGETMAVLAGDALQSAAFSMLARAEDLSAAQRMDAVSVLSAACGYDGMVAGQVLDLRQHEDLDALLLLHSLKTGAMFSAAAELGCIAAGAGAAAREKSRLYAQKLGLAFQVCDDLLDVTGTESELGKTIGSDRQQEKFTFVDLLGVDGARDYALRCTQEVKEVFGNEAEDASFLIELADRLLVRRN